MATNRSFWEIAFSQGSIPTKEELEGPLFIVKQIVGLLAGVTAGLLQLKGPAGFGLYLIVSTVVVYLYANNFLEVEEDAVDTKELVKDNFMVGFMTFVLWWVIVFNAV